MEFRIRHNESAGAYFDPSKIHLDEELNAGITIDAKLQAYIFLNSLVQRFESFINFQAHVFQHGEVIDEAALPKLFTALIEMRSEALWIFRCSINDNPSSKSTIRPQSRQPRHTRRRLQLLQHTQPH
ncbi:hypothetical protein H310_07678 [Aphanomyces invadans]|uniref:Uncharacterized protein n=1 Tax=Aphanomyces invadans TaxID=157072 RepID=A0A024U260_9STRA|nr:hypothetical protein H310_07678 [Aphanomyces invadans]ETW00305.1 hypothetical protein H310_07678 [Aphanomyces invadans]|eukprot:XP_008871330.1 hypothetical protein H310_07678 [Aphanomyces invadans]